MSLQFIMGNSGAGKSRYAYQKILAEAMRHPEKTYLIIVPEQFTMQTQKELVSLHPAGGILNVDILSFQRLAYRIFEETGGSLYPVLEETGKSLVVKRVAQEKEKGADDSWKYVKENRRSFADEIVDFRAEAVSDCAVRA